MASADLSYFVSFNLANIEEQLSEPKARNCHDVIDRRVELGLAECQNNRVSQMQIVTRFS
jgi:hypothetical protein